MAETKNAIKKNGLFLNLTQTLTRTEKYVFHSHTLVILRRILCFYFKKEIYFTLLIAQLVHFSLDFLASPLCVCNSNCY